MHTHLRLRVDAVKKPGSCRTQETWIWQRAIPVTALSTVVRSDTLRHWVLPQILKRSFIQQRTAEELTLEL